MKEIVYLVVRADRSVRVAKKPRMAADEVGIKVTLTFPDTWGRVVGEFAVNMPDPTPTVTDVSTEVPS